MKASSHWKSQRKSAILLLILIPWFAFNIVGKTYPQMVEYSKAGYPFFGLMTLWFIGIYHGYMGIEVILDDYIHNEDTKKKIKKRLLLLFIVPFSFLLHIIFR